MHVFWAAVALLFSAAQAGHETPVQRVVKLLRDMKAQLDTEASKESEMYDKMVCWCETGEKDKTKAIAVADMKITDLESSIQAMSAKFGSVGTDIEALKKQVARDTEALKEATAIREGEAEQFREGEKDVVQALTNLNNAIMILGRHQGGGASLLQLDGPTRASVRAVLRDVTATYDLRLGARAPRGRGGVRRAAPVALLAVAEGDPSRRLQDVLGLPAGADRLMPGDLAGEQLSDLVRRGGLRASSLLQSGGHLAPTAGSYSPQSGTIFGILEQMKEEFEANLKQDQELEAKAVEDFEALKAAKAEQIAAGKESLDAMENEHAENIKALSDAKEDLTLTTEQRAEDVEYLRNLRLSCQDLDSQWDKRSALRSEETKAVAEAIAIITEDDAREQLSKSIALLQLRSSSGMQAETRARRAGAAAVLRRAAENADDDDDELIAAWRHRGGPRTEAAAGGPKVRLSTLAVSVELDDFAKVKEAMDKMLVDLKAEQSEEVQLKAYCQKELAANEKMDLTKSDHKEDLETKIELLGKTIKTLEEEIAEDQTTIADTKEAMKSAGQTREAENKEFQSVVSDQRAAQTILKKALLRLKAFYDKQALLQGRNKALQTPPAQFTDYAKNAGGVSVVGLLEQIVGDSEALEKEAVASEASAQSSYESYAKGATAEVKSLEGSISKKSTAVADAKVDSGDTLAELGNTVEELAALAQTNADLHGECDFTLENFDIRQKARLEETEAIQSAKAFLSGAKG